SRVTMSGNRITVTLKLLDVFFPEPPPGTFEQKIGRLPAGSYQVEVLRGDVTPAVSLGTATFTVAPRPAGQPIDDYSDIWWNANESGWGLNVAQRANGNMYATWFVYAADGSPMWYVMPGGRWTDASTFEGDVYRATGPEIYQFSASQVTRTPAGTATFI